MKYEEYIKEFTKLTNIILEKFHTYLIYELKLRDLNAQQHLLNVEMFRDYLMKFTKNSSVSIEEWQTLTNFKCFSVNDFLGEWYLEECLWSSKDNLKKILRSLRFFLNFLVKSKLSNLEESEYLRMQFDLNNEEKIMKYYDKNSTLFPEFIKQFPKKIDFRAIISG